MTKQEATRAARAALKQMKTPGWRIRVHENGDWYWNLYHVDGHFNIYPGFREGFHCLLSSGDYQNTGSLNWLDSKNYMDPNRAVREQVRLLRGYERKIIAWSHTVRDALGISD